MKKCKRRDLTRLIKRARKETKLEEIDEVGAVLQDQNQKEKTLETINENTNQQQQLETLKEPEQRRGCVGARIRKASRRSLGKFRRN
jgi:hypothetical protein